MLGTVPSLYMEDKAILYKLESEYADIKREAAAQRRMEKLTIEKWSKAEVTWDDSSLCSPYKEAFEIVRDELEREFRLDIGEMARVYVYGYGAGEASKHYGMRKYYKKFLHHLLNKGLQVPCGSFRFGRM